MTEGYGHWVNETKSWKAGEINLETIRERVEVERETERVRKGGRE